MKLNPHFRLAAYRAYFDQTKIRFELKKDEIDRYTSMHEWDSVRSAAIDLAGLAQILRDTENRIADLE